VAFVPHLVPVDRGLLSTCYARVSGEVPGADALRARYEERYAAHPFVEVRDAAPDMRAVQRTNDAHVAVVPEPESGRVVAFGVIDNLVKGAAGQAVQNLNLMAGRPEDEGLR
jgi:N-acetyl-gamma-glutamyl-phosphate reductase